MIELVTVKKNPDVRLFPLYNVKYFAEHKEDWMALKQDKEIEVPEEIFRELSSHFIKVKKQTKKIKHETFKDGEE